MRRAATIAVISALIIVAAAAAAMRSFAGTTPVPHPPKGQGEHCVADTGFMRKNHMKMLMHHRNEAVHLGVRTEQYDLNRCVACHAVAGPDAKPVGFDSPQHFCRSCHTYAAVSIDCFECHASRSDARGRTAATQRGNEEVAAIDQYRREIRP